MSCAADEERGTSDLSHRLDSVMPKTKLLFVGNCQKTTMAKLAEILAFDAEVNLVHTAHLNSFGAARYEGMVSESDIVFTQPLIGEKFGAFEENTIAATHPRVFFFPTLVFSGYHPDSIYLGSGKYMSPIGGYHSAIAALAFRFGYDAGSALRFYTSEAYRELGYFEAFGKEVTQLTKALMRFEIDLGVDIDALMRRRCMMHSINHPSAELLSLLTSTLLKNAGVKIRDIDASRYLVDVFPDSVIFPLFPEIGEKIGLSGSYLFKADAKAAASGKAMYDLPDFLDATFANYEAIRDNVLENPRFTPVNVDRASDLFKSLAPIKPTTRSLSKHRHPYSDFPDFHFWKKSFSGKQPSEVDIAVDMTPFVGGEDKIATAGSCFAQHIAKALSSSGYRYFIAETADQGTSKADAIANGYGIFSARYGNLYTTRQLVQLFDRAFGNFDPCLPVWKRNDERVVDPFRPQVASAGFADTEAMLADRATHLAAVRRMFKELDIFVFTLGLTEAWRHKATGAVLPLAPATVAGEMTDEYEAVNFNYDEVLGDLSAFVTKLREVNPRSQILLTVSPVPLAASFERRHVLVSTTASKAILRAVADQAVRSMKGVRYFPSYEIITGNYNKGKYYEEDLREVTPEGVSHVMRTFLAHCVHPIREEVKGAGELDELGEIVCDEEALAV